MGVLVGEIAGVGVVIGNGVSISVGSREGGAVNVGSTWETTGVGRAEEQAARNTKRTRNILFISNSGVVQLAERCLGCKLPDSRVVQS